MNIFSKNNPFYEYVYLESTFKLESGSINGAGVLFRHWRADTTSIYWDSYLKFKDLVPTPVLNKWYTVSKVVKISQTGDFGGYSVYPMASFSSIDATMPANVIYFDSVITRPATEQEISAYESKLAIDEMTSDMKITPLEKQTLRRDWDAIKYEYSQVLPQGQAIQSVSTSAYTTAYNNLNAVSPKIDSEILANMSTTYSFASTSARDTFRNQLNKYFDEAEKVKRAIAETTNDLNRELAQAISTGRMMYTDPIFKNGMNSIQVYNNTSGSAVTATRVAAPTDAPTTSSSVIEIKTTGAASPSHGGFQHPINSRAGAKFLFESSLRYQ